MRDECFEPGEEPRVCSLTALVQRLKREGAKHRALYHYTRWDSFANMMRPVDHGVCEGHRMMHLSPADKMNDKVEKGWGRNVFMTCFSYSKYEDVAMWMNYGKRSPNAVRVKIDGNAVAAWWREHNKRKNDIFAVREDGRGGYEYDPLDPGAIASVELADVAYVIHGKLLGGRHWGNIEYSRKFYCVRGDDGGFEWSDNIYDGDPRKGNAALPAFFKKRGWGYERETRLVITLKDRIALPPRLAVFFDGPFATLSAVSQGMRPPVQCVCEEGEEGYRGRHCIMRGPWFHTDTASNTPVGSMKLADVGFDSDYASEIDIVSSMRMGISELVVRANKYLEENQGHACAALHSDDRRYLGALGGDFRSAAKTINRHIDKCNYRPNKYKLARLEILDPERLAKLSFVDKWAAIYLKVLREMDASSKNGWKDRISHVPRYGG